MADWTAIPFRRFPKADEGRAWDGAGARRRLKEWAGDDWAKYRQGFALYDKERSEVQAGYKLPHHDVIDGRVHVVWSGVRAAMSALLGGRGGLSGVPRQAREAAHGHLAQEYALFDREPPEFRVYGQAELEALFGAVEADEMDDWQRDDAPVDQGAMLARVGAVETPDEAQLARINRLALTPLEADQVVAFPVTASTTQLDTYGTRMALSSLYNCVQDAIRGLPWMNSHRTGGWLGSAELPHGQTFDGALEGEGDEAQLVEWVYMQRGLTLNGQANDDLIKALSGGTVRSNSIGFSLNPVVAPGAYFLCGLCDLDLFDPDCPHIPLLHYDGELAFAWVENARQVELSMVWRGATPGALVGKARQLAESGRLVRLEVERLEELYGVRLRAPQRYFEVKAAGGGVGGRLAGSGGGSDLEPEEIRQQIVAARPDLEARMQAADDPVGALLEFLRGVETGHDDLAAQLTQATARIADLEPLADEGRVYRADLVELAVQARVRAQGPNFDVTGYTAQLLVASLDYVKSEIGAHDRAAEQVFQPGRPTRQSEGPRRRPVDAHLYR